MVGNATTVQPWESETKSEALHRSRHAGWGIWLHWVVYSVVGYLFYETTNTALSLAIPGLWGQAAGFLGSIVGVAVVAFLQWLVLRRTIPRMGLLGWVLATVLGQFLAIMVLVFTVLTPVILGVLGDLPELVGAQAIFSSLLLVSGAIMGAVVGIAQWLVLRKHLPGAGWWILACAAGGALNRIVQATPLASGLTGVIATRTIGWALFSIVTGLVLLWLLRRHWKNSQPVNYDLSSRAAPTMEVAAKKVCVQSKSPSTPFPRPFDVEKHRHTPRLPPS